MDRTENFPIIVNANISGNEKEKLLTVLSGHRKVLGYSMKDVIGTDASIYSHAIPIEEGAKPVIVLAMNYRLLDASLSTPHRTSSTKSQSSFHIKSSSSSFHINKS